MKKILNIIKENKAFIFPWVVLAGLVVLLVSGLTYAYFDYIDGDSGGGSSMRLTATDLKVDLSLSTINLSNMMPIYDEYKDTKANTFNFTMSNTSRKLAGCVDLYLEITSISEVLKNTDFKWELVNNTTSTTTSGDFLTIKDDKIILKTNENIPISTTYSYTLKIWYSYKDDVDQSGILGASLSSKIMSIAYGGACNTPMVTTYTTVGTTEFTASEDGYYKIETYNINGDYASGEIMLADNEKLYFSISNTSGTPTSIKCFIDSSTGLCGTQGSQNENNSRIMYAKTNLSQSFISGYAGVNAPVYVNSSSELSNNTIHPTGKFFLNGDIRFGTANTTPQVVVTYLGKYANRINTSLDNVRYIKDCTNGSTAYASNHFVEIQAIKNGTNIAYNKTVTGTSGQKDNTTRAYSYIVDGQVANITGTSGYGEPSGTGNQCVTIDLGSTYNLDEVAVWHYYTDGRTYYSNVTSVSSDNSNWTEVMSGLEPETMSGKRINAYSEPAVGYVQDGLLAWYDGISNTGTTRSTTTTTWKNLANLSSYNGTITGGTWGDSYLTFDGTSTWVNLGEINNTTFTQEAVFSATTGSTGTVQYLVANIQGGGVGLMLTTTGRFGGMVYGTSKVGYNWVYSPTSLVAQNNVMYNSSHTYDGTTQKLFVNGLRTASTNIIDTIKFPNNSTVMAIGTNPSGSAAVNEYFGGKVYSVRIYNRGLTEEEIYHNSLVDKKRFAFD